LEVDRYDLRLRQKTKSLDSKFGRKDIGFNGFIGNEADGSIQPREHVGTEVVEHERSYHVHVSNIINSNTACTEHNNLSTSITLRNGAPALANGLHRQIWLVCGYC
jgi:hypothetical protein